MREAGFNGRIIPEIWVNELVKFRAVDACFIVARAPADGQDMLYLGVEEAFAEDAMSDHAGGSENQDVHRASITISSTTEDLEPRGTQRFTGKPWDVRLVS